MEGVVSLEDLLEELVGEIYDESDIAPLDLVPARSRPCNRGGHLRVYVF